jgi:TRAP-type C4-dicarboxylate transport system permease small subunit
MTAIFDSLTPSLRKGLMIIITSSTSAMMFVLAAYAVNYVWTVYELGGIYPALRVPFFAVYTVAPIGLFLAGVQYGLAAMRNLTSSGIYLSFERRDEYAETFTQEV